MTVILTCGYPPSFPTKIHDILVAARLIRPIGSEQETLQLQTKILEGAGLGLNGAFADGQLTPGKEYKELANGILRANPSDYAFGWAGSGTLWLVDFWRVIDEETRFIFVYSRPEDALAELLKATEVSGAAFEKALSNWTAYYTEVFRCYFQNPGRCLLIHADTIREPSIFIGKVLQFLEVAGSNNLPTLPEAESEKSAINAVLIRAGIAARGFRLDLYDEMESSADIPGTSSSVHDWMLCEQAHSQYSALLAREVDASAQQRADQTRQEELASLGARLNAELLEQRIETSTWKQRADDLQSVEATLTSELREQRNQTSAWKQRADSLQSVEATLTSELHEQRNQTSSWKQRADNLQSVEATLTSELNEQRNQTNSWKQRADDLQSVEATLTSELNEQRNQTSTWKQRADDLQSVEATLTSELGEQRIQTSYWKQLADEFEALSRDRGVRVKLLESDAVSLSNKLAEHEKCLGVLSAESERLRAEDLELRNECALVTQQWLRTEEELDRQKLRVKDINDAAAASLAAKDDAAAALLVAKDDAAAASLAAKDQELEHWRQKNRELENDNAIAAAEIGHLQRELESALSQLARLTADSTQETSRPRSEVAVHSNEISCDFREHIDGDNWYDAEHDGRWAGPRSVSAVRLPRLGPGEYQFEIEVVDAMDPQFIVKMEVLLNGKPIEFASTRRWKRYPVLLKGQFSTSMVPERDFWEFQFAFPGLISPSDNGLDDKRLLAVRVRTLRVALLQSLA